jgi:hypothetical protein
MASFKLIRSDPDDLALGVPQAECPMNHQPAKGFVKDAMPAIPDILAGLLGAIRHLVDGTEVWQWPLTGMFRTLFCYAVSRSARWKEHTVSANAAKFSNGTFSPISWLEPQM